MLNERNALKSDTDSPPHMRGVYSRMSLVGLGCLVAFLHKAVLNILMNS